MELTVGNNIHSTAVLLVAAGVGYLGENKIQVKGLDIPDLKVNINNDHPNAPVLLVSQSQVGELTVAATIARHLVRASAQFPLLAEQDGDTEEDHLVVEEWIASFQNETPISNNSVDGVFDRINKQLLPRTYLCFKRLSVSDLLWFGALSAVVPSTPLDKLKQYPNLLRWYIHIQHVITPWLASRAVLHNRFQLLNLPLAPSKMFNIGAPAAAVETKKEEAKQAGDNNKAKDNKDNKNKQDKDKSKENTKEKKQDSAEKDNNKDNKKAKAKNEKKAEEVDDSDEKVGGDIARIEIRVGKILSAKKHPTADRLYVEEIDLGEEKPRTIVSGLASFIPLDKMQGLCLVVSNLAPASLKDVTSYGMVLAATSKQDANQKELVTPPPNAKVGEVITFRGVTAAPDQPLAAKRLHKIVKELHTNEQRVVQYKDLDFMTSAGACVAATIASGTVA